MAAHHSFQTDIKQTKDLITARAGWQSILVIMTSKSKYDCPLEHLKFAQHLF